VCFKCCVRPAHEYTQAHWPQPPPVPQYTMVQGKMRGLNYEPAGFAHSNGQPLSTAQEAAHGAARIAAVTGLGIAAGRKRCLAATNLPDCVTIPATQRIGLAPRGGIQGDM
jgi:DNA-binding transcriptional LysR family regulator